VDLKQRFRPHVPHRRIAHDVRPIATSSVLWGPEIQQAALGYPPRFRHWTNSRHFKDTEGRKPHAGSQPIAQHRKVAIPELRPGWDTVFSFLIGVFENDLNFKVRGLPSEYRSDAQQLAMAFQNEFLELITPTAREALLNETQISYVRNVVAGTYHLDINPQGVVSSRCDQAQVLAVATYLNSLR